MAQPGGYYDAYDQPLYSQGFDPFAQSYSMYEDIWFWVVIASIAGVALKVWGVYAMTRSFQNMFSPFRGAPPERSAEELRHERMKWCLWLAAAFFIGGLVLFVLGARGDAGDIEVANISVKNAAPGTVFVVAGLALGLTVIKKD